VPGLNELNMVQHVYWGQRVARDDVKEHIIIDRLRAKYPKLEIESCSGGGGPRRGDSEGGTTAEGPLVRASGWADGQSAAVRRGVPGVPPSLEACQTALSGQRIE
jgi:hypothetical protein